MSHITLPAQADILPAIPADEFDPLVSVYSQGGATPVQPYTGLGLHFDYTIRGRLTLAAFTVLFTVYCWLTGLGRRLIRSRN